jgi:GT2 family glycosyltransferase
MNNGHLITLSIVSHGDANKIDHLLGSIQEHEPATSRFQLIITDNLGNELPDFNPSSWGSLQILRNEKPVGFAQNHNRAFGHANGKYFVVLNPDLIFEQAVFDGLISRLHEQQVDMIAPGIVDKAGVVQDSYRGLPTPMEIIRRRLPGYRFQPHGPDLDGLIHPDWIAAMFWLMPSRVYQLLGGMDEKFRLYFEDVDFCARARIKGMKFVVDTRLTVRHDAQRSSRRNLYYLFLHGQSAMRFFRSPVYRQVRSL